MARVLRMSWRNGGPGKWTGRIRWYDNNDDLTSLATSTNIRLHLETEERAYNLYPKTVAEAETIWETFKREHKK